MAHSYFVRITHSYEAIEPLVHAWALITDRLAVYEHVGDRTQKVHCHLLVVGSRVEKKQLRNIGTDAFKRKGANISIAGNGNCSFKPLDISYDSIFHTLTYMSKGKYDPSYNREFDPITIAEAKAAWVEQLSPQEQVYQDFLKIYLKPASRLDWHKSNNDFGLHNRSEEDYNEFVYRVVKGQVQSFCMKRFKVFSQACCSQVKMLICTVYYYHDYTLPSRLERITF